METHNANELVNQLLNKYEKEIENAPRGKLYQEYYDIQTRKTNEGYIRLYSEVKEELAGMGIPFQS